MTETPLELGLLISDKHENGYYHVYARPVTINAEKQIRNAHEFKGYWIDDLEVSSQGDTRSAGLYAFDVSFAAYRVNRINGPKIVRTLKKIDKGLDKLVAARGWPESYGEYVARVAEILGATSIVFPAPKGNCGWSYDDGAYQFRSLGEGRSQINRLVDQWRKGEEVGA